MLEQLVSPNQESLQSTWHLTSGSIVEKGLKRNNCEDRVLKHDRRRRYVLCDGMGGTSGGGEAAEIVSQTAATYLDEHIDPPNTPLKNWWVKYHGALKAAQHSLRNSHELPADSDTTAVFTMIEHGSHNMRIIEGVSIGDSRVYVWNGSKKPEVSSRLQMITHDNSFLYGYCQDYSLDYYTVQKAVDNGADPFMLCTNLGEYLGRLGIAQDVITVKFVKSRVCIGVRDYDENTTDKVKQPSYFRKEMEKDDRILICSDGLYEELSFNEIDEIMLRHKHLDSQKLAEKLRDAAKKKCMALGTKSKGDDLSIIIIDSSDRPKPKFTPLQKRIALGVVAAAGVIATALGIGHIGSDDTPVVTPKPLSSPTSTPTSAPYRPTVRPAATGGVQVGPPPTATAPPTLEYKVPIPKPTSTLHIPVTKKP